MHGKTFLLGVFVVWTLVPSVLLAEKIPLVQGGGVYHVPVAINGVLTLDFVLDTGAAEVNIPVDVALTLLRSNTITDADFLPGATYVLADGSEVRSNRVNLRTLSVGTRQVHNIPASIGNVRSPLLLGQSFFERLGSWGIDHRRHVLVLDTAQPAPPTARDDALPHTVIHDVQALLQTAGFDPGPRDGVLGQRTRHALRAYQSAHGLPVTGEVDAGTLQRLQETLPSQQSSVGLVVSPLRFSSRVVRLGERFTIFLEAINTGPQMAYGVVMLNYLDQLVSFMALHTNDKDSQVQLPNAPSPATAPGSPQPKYRVLWREWPDWHPGERRTATITLVPRLAHDLRLHLSVVLHPAQAPGAPPHRWSSIVSLPFASTSW